MSGSRFLLQLLSRHYISLFLAFMAFQFFGCSFMPRSTIKPLPATSSAETSASLVTLHPKHEFFDDFTYSSQDDPAMRKFGWVVRTARGIPGPRGAKYSRANVSILRDLENPNNRLMRLSATTWGTSMTTEQAEVGTKRARFFEGVFAARVYLRDTPIHGPAGDGIVEAPLFTLNRQRYDYDPKYSECDYEYLPRDVWARNDAPTMYYSTWEKFRLEPWDTIKKTNTTVGSLEGWRILIIQISGGNVRFYVDGKRMAPAHSGACYPRALMRLMFQIWFDRNSGVSTNRNFREWAIDVDWVYHAKNAVLNCDEVQQIVARLRKEGVARKDTMGWGWEGWLGSGR